jgi:hypothetical protein
MSLHIYEADITVEGETIPHMTITVNKVWLDKRRRSRSFDADVKWRGIGPYKDKVVKARIVFGCVNKWNDDYDVEPRVMHAVRSNGDKVYYTVVREPRYHDA